MRTQIDEHNENPLNLKWCPILKHVCVRFPDQKKNISDFRNVVVLCLWGTSAV